MLELTSNVPLNKNCFLLDHPYLKLSVETCYPVLSNGKQDQKRIYSPPRITSKTDTTQVYPPRLFVSEIQSGAGWGLTASTVGSIGHKIPWFPKAVFFFWFNGTIFNYNLDSRREASMGQTCMEGSLSVSFLWAST